MSLWAPSTFAQQTASEWNRVSLGSRLYSVAWSGSSYVAVGDRGTIYQSMDGESWTFRESPVKSQIIISVAWGNNTFVAVSVKGEILTSPDGIKWTIQRDDPKSSFSSVKWINNQFVAVGAYTNHNGPLGTTGHVLVSPNGETWTVNEATTNGNFFEPLNAIDWGNDQYVAVGSFGSIYTSADGVKWTPQNSSMDDYNHFYAVAWGNNTLVAAGTGGQIHTSTDNGVTWTAHNFTNNRQLFSAVLWTNGKFMVFGNTDVLISSDGQTWASYPYGVTDQWSDGIKGAVWGNNEFIAVGDDSMVFSSRDGERWSTQKTAAVTNQQISSVTWGNSGFVAVGENGTIINSSDGIVWTKQDSGVTTSLSEIAWGNGLYVVVGEQNILTSSDGEKWTPNTSKTNNRYSTIAWGNGKFVAGGSGNTLQYSSDGITWTSVTVTNSGYIPSVSWVGDQFIASTVDMKLLTSPDGVTWTPRETGINDVITNVVKGDGKFLGLLGGITGEFGNIATSDNGITWTTSSLSTDTALRSVHYAGNQYTVVDSRGYIYTSSDGTNWTTQNPVAGTLNINLTDVTWGNNRLVAVGGQALIYTAPFVVSAQQVGTVTGSVYDSNQSAIDGASVSIGPISTTTNAQGAFTLTNVGSGEQTIMASAPGYVSGSRSVSVVTGQNVDAGTITLQSTDIQEVGTVTGSVYDSNQSAINGASVSIGQISTTTNAQGAFTLTNVGSGEQTITASASGYVSGSRSVSVVTGQNVDAGTITLQSTDIQEAGTVTGSVYDSNQSAINGASVSIGQISTTTNAQGAFTLTNVQAGLQTILASAPGYVDNTKSVTISAGQNIDAGIIMLARSSGKSKDRDNSPSPSVPTIPTAPIDTKAEEGSKPAENTPATSEDSSELVQDPNDIFRSQVVRADSNVITGVQARTAEILKAGSDAKTIDYSDIDQHWAISSIKKLTKLGVINGYPEGGFEPDEQITRAEFAAMITRGFVDMAGRTVSIQPGDSAEFSDINDHWSSDYLKKLVSVGVMTGYGDGTIRPEQTISRQEMAVMITRVLNPYILNQDTSNVQFTDLNGSYAPEEIKKVTVLGIFNGKNDQTFDPLGGATRAESIETIINTYKLSPAIKEALSSLE
ncbi:S-layer homology domain-containing protein [Paenibacillus polymyxa]|uniref:S-layer homology domain-containing protein n=1 Tax=Paenibacillus polymyxa TaxID=1406 RepID=UPI002AB43C2E|nr:S-layer homology domain-containing protein [Paenibacillus polymyxa]MDY8045809.1 S-layer homology domain-containing protein [Paenibacillus polymyxa]